MGASVSVIKVLDGDKVQKIFDSLDLEVPDILRGKKYKSLSDVLYELTLDTLKREEDKTVFLEKLVSSNEAEILKALEDFHQRKEPMDFPSSSTVEQGELQVEIMSSEDISKDELECLKYKFAWYDTDDSGKLTKSEIGNLLRDIGFADSMLADHIALITIAKTNKTGEEFITFQEFEKLYSKLKKKFWLQLTHHKLSGFLHSKHINKSSMLKDLVENGILTMNNLVECSADTLSKFDAIKDTDEATNLLKLAKAWLAGFEANAQSLLAEQVQKETINRRMTYAPTRRESSKRRMTFLNKKY